MRQWMVLYEKEMLEMWRGGKWIWVPIVFLILGLTQPISSYYLPEILNAAGGLPEGAVIQIPLPKPPEVLVETLSQYGTMGILILVLAMMGIVSSERTGGVAAMILVKPVKFASYITAKWAGQLTLGLVSFAAGYGISWYYTGILIGSVDAGKALAGFAVYSLWLVFVMTLTLLLSTCLRGNGAVAFVTLFIAAALSIVSTIFKRYMGWSPGRLSDHAGSFLVTGSGQSAFTASLIVTVLLIGAMVAAAVYVLRHQEFPE